MQARTASEPGARNVSFQGATRPPPLQNTQGAAPSERPPLSGTSTISEPAGDLSDDTRYGAAYDDSVIPPSHPYRTLVVAYDGTGDQFDDDVSLCGASSTSRDLLWPIAEFEHRAIIFHAQERR